MIGVNVTFEYGGGIDRARVVAVAENARGMFEGMPGLRFKSFTFDEAHHRATGLYGVAPTIDFVEIAQIVDNSAS